MSLNHSKSWIATLLLLTTFITPVWSIGDGEFLPVEEAFQLQVLKSSSDAKGQYFVAKWQITPEHYLYRDKIKIIVGDREIYFPKPASQTIDDPYFGTVAIYRNHLAIAFDSGKESMVKVTWQGCADAGLCYPPVTESFDLTQVGLINYTALQSEQSQLADYISRSTLLLSALVFLGLGVLLAFTPCVLPMVPILSGIITSSSNVHHSTKRSFALSLVYVLSMGLTYSVAGVLIALFGSGFQLWLQHPLVITISAGVFILLAFAMFGFYNLQLPPALSTKISALGNSQRGNWSGAIIMGVFSALIVSPCVTPPLIGALLFVARSGDALTGGIILFSLALGMGLPLLLIGTSLGRFIPKSRDVLNVIKHIGGFILLAVAIWLLDRITNATTTALLGGIFITALGLYLLIAISPRLLLSRLLIILVIAYGLLLSLHAVNGGNNWSTPWQLDKASQQNNETNHTNLSMFTKTYDLQGIFQTIEANRATQKPTMLVVYADWCISCKELEVFTFSNTNVQALFKQINSFEVDITTPNQASRQVLNHFQLFGPPAILFFDVAGNEIQSARIVGFIGADDFIAHLQQLLAT